MNLAILTSLGGPLTWRSPAHFRGQAGDPPPGEALDPGRKDRLPVQTPRPGGGGGIPNSISTLPFGGSSNFSRLTAQVSS